MNLGERRRWLNRAAAVILPMVLIGQASFAQPAGPSKKVFRWARFEAQFTSSGDYENPLQDVRVEVDFTSPTGKTRSVEAFWYGARNWKARSCWQECFFVPLSPSGIRCPPGGKTLLH